MEVTTSWLLSAYLPAAIYLFSLAYALFHAFRRGQPKPTGAVRIYWIACASVMLLGTAIVIDIANRSPAATALAGLGMLIVCVGIFGVSVGVLTHATAGIFRHFGRKHTPS